MARSQKCIDRVMEDVSRELLICEQHIVAFNETLVELGTRVGTGPLTIGGHAGSKSGQNRPSGTPHAGSDPDIWGVQPAESQITCPDMPAG